MLAEVLGSHYAGYASINFAPLLERVTPPVRLFGLVTSDVGWCRLGDFAREV